MSKTEKKETPKDPEKKDTTDLAAPPKEELVVIDTGEFSNLLDTAKFNQMWRVAVLFAKTELVPKQYKGKPSDCFLAVQMAVRLGVEPMMFMQNTYVVNGTPGMEAKLSIALINTKGPFEGPIQWKFTGAGKTRQCTAYATHSRTKEVCEATVTWAMVEAEGWSRNPKWTTMPDMMFSYRSATFLGRLYCPEVLLGMQTIDELVDVGKDQQTYDETAKDAKETIQDSQGSEEVDATFEDAGGEGTVERTTFKQPPRNETKTEDSKEDFLKD